MSNKKLNLSILSPEAILYEGEIEGVTLPGALGTFTILPQHAPIVSSLHARKVTFTTGGKQQTIDIDSGFIEMNGEEVTVCITQSKATNGK